MTAIAGATLRPIAYATAQGTGLLRSVDGGRRWFATSITRPAGPIATSPDGQTVLAAGESMPGTPVHVSRDGGRTWRSGPLVVDGRPLATWGASAVAIDPARPSTMLMAGGGCETAFRGTRLTGVLLSRDFGRTWTLRGTRRAGTPQALALVPGRSRILIIATVDGIYRSRDLGRRWSRVARAPRARPAIDVSSLVAGSGRTPALFYGDVFGLWIGCDGGRAWRRVAQRPGGLLISDLAISADRRRLIVSGRRVIAVRPVSAMRCPVRARS